MAVGEGGSVALGEGTGVGNSVDAAVAGANIADGEGGTGGFSVAAGSEGTGIDVPVAVEAVAAAGPVPMIERSPGDSLAGAVARGVTVDGPGSSAANA